ncbi:MFS family permease [Altererythrobacter atlanticus]|uniref:MFS transporter n=1 Tax=Croceibacterium atlanticum TaxID=1267766 RepID=UPI000AEC3DD7|nr:MFS transporter [Croceibacterium atlanticum]MBB5732848.1 MFS family permease [Croceibacterium atlanticum]
MNEITAELAGETPEQEDLRPHYKEDPWPTMGQAYFAAWVLAIAQMCAQLNNGVMTLMVEPVKRDLDLTDLQMSYLLGFSAVLFYALVGIPAARLVDRYNRKWLMIVSVAIWSAATAACGMAANFWQFFAARFGIGTGEAINGPLSYSLLADHFQPERLPRGIAIYNVGLQGGAALSLLLGAFLIYITGGLPTVELPWLGTVRDWQMVFVFTGLTGIPVILLLTLMGEPKRRGIAAQRARTGAATVNLRDVLAYLFRHWRLYGPMFLGLSLTSIHMLGLGAWSAAFYTRTYGWEPATIGLYSGLVSLVLAAPALFGAVWFNELLTTRGHADTNLRVMAIGITAAAPFTIAMPFMPSPWLALAMGGIGPALMLVAAPSLNTALQIITPNEMRGQVTAIYLFTMFAAGGSIGPTLFAFLTQEVFGDESMLRYAVAASATITFPLAALTYWLGLRPYRQRILEMRAEGAPV